MQKQILVLTTLLANANAQGFIGGLADATSDAAPAIVDQSDGFIGGLATETTDELPCLVNCAAAEPEIIEEDPVSAAIELAATAQAEASQAIHDYSNSVLDTIKLTNGFENMNEEQQAIFEAQYEEDQAAAAVFDSSDRTASGYHEMENTAKTIYDAQMLKWIQKVTEDCQASETAPGCLFAQAVRVAETTARLEFGYYGLDEEGRVSWDERRAYEDASLVAAQTNQWHVNNVPAYGNVGSACSRQNRCLQKTHCCGTFTRFDDNSIQLDGRCHTPAQAYTDELGYEWTHQCGASKLITAVAAFLVSAYLI